MTSWLKKEIVNERCRLQHERVHEARRTKIEQQIDENAARLHVALLESAADALFCRGIPLDPKNRFFAVALKQRLDLMFAKVPTDAEQENGVTAPVTSKTDQAIICAVMQQRVGIKMEYVSPDGIIVELPADLASVSIAKDCMLMRRMFEMVREQLAKSDALTVPVFDASTALLTVLPKVLRSAGFGVAYSETGGDGLTISLAFEPDEPDAKAPRRA